MVVASFLRLVTHPKIFVQPTPMAEALRFVDALLSAPGADMPELGAEWPALRTLCGSKTISGDDVPVAWLAATAIHQGGHVVSFDAVFKRLLPASRFTWLSV